MLINIADKFKRGDTLTGWYRGIVFENFDPKGLGRCKVFVEGRLVATAEDLPWSFPKPPADRGGTPSSARTPVPEIGSIIIIEFPFDDIYFPVYSGKWLSANTQALGFLENYPETSSDRDEEGNGTEINKAKQTLETTHSSGSGLKFSKDGSATVSSGKRVCLETDDGSASLELDNETGKTTISSLVETEIKAENTTVTSNLHTNVVGSLVNKVSGAEETEVVGGRSTSVGGSESKSVGSHQAVIVSGNKSTTVIGETSETLGSGKSTDVVIGSLIENLLAGDREVNIVAGNLLFKTLAGKAEVGNVLGGLLVNEAGQINIKGLGSELLDLIDQILSEIIQMNTDLSLLTVGTAVGISSPPVNASLFVGHVATLTTIKTLLLAMKA